MKGLAIIVDRAGPYKVTEFDGDGDALRAVLGGWLEPAPSDESVTVWCNEDGKSLDLPINRLAMAVWERWDIYGCMSVGRDFLVGNVVITGPADRSTGETLDITDEARSWVLRVAAACGATIEVTAPDWTRFGLVDADDDEAQS